MNEEKMIEVSEAIAVSTDDVETLRMIEVAVQVAEEGRDSDDDIEACLEPSRRSSFPAAPIGDDDE